LKTYSKSSCEWNVGKKKLKKKKKTPLDASSFGNGLNKFLVGIVECTTTHET
jgi:hypothetical protein